MMTTPCPDDAHADEVEELVCRCLLADDLDVEFEVVARERPELTDRVRRILARLREEELIDGPQGADSVPDKLGEFRLLHEIGAGGMGVVYLAVQEGLSRRIALKILRREHLYLPGARERFRREIETVANLQHPGIVPVFTGGEHAGVPYFAMEYVDGESLSEVIRQLGERATLRGSDLVDLLRTDASDSGSGTPSATMLRQSWPNACATIVRQIAEALDHAHQRGVLHRDVKPSNVLLTRDGYARVVDFGLARVEGDPQLTRTTTQLGSLPYLPPERLQDRPAVSDPTMDVYGLGVTLYELIALRNPFLGKNSAETQTNVLAGSPPSLRSAARAPVRWELETVCLKAIDPAPDQRYRTMAEFARDLERALAGEPIAARRAGFALRTKRWIQRHPRLAAAGTALLLSVPLFAIVFAFEQARATEHATGLASDREREAYAASVLAASLHLDERSSPSDARALLESCPQRLRGWEWHHLALRLQSGRALAALGAQPELGSWGPDGDRVLITTKAGDAHVVTIEPSRVVTFELDGPLAACMGRDLWFSAFDATGNIAVRDPATGARLRTLQGAHETEVTAIAWLDPRRRLCSGDASGQIVIWDVDTGTVERAWSSGQAGVRQLAPSGDASRLAVATGDPAMMRGQTRVFDLDDGTRLDAITTRGLSCVALSQDGTWILWASGGPVTSKRVGAGEPTTIVEGHYSVFSLSSNEQTLATAELGSNMLTLHTVDLAQPDSTADLQRIAGLDGYTFVLRRRPIATEDEYLTVDEGRVVRLWTPRSSGSFRRYGPLPSTAAASEFDADADSLWLGTWRRGLFVLDLGSGEIKALESPHEHVRRIRRVGTRMVTVGYGWRAVLWESNAAARWIVPDKDDVSCATVDGSGQTVVTGTLDGRVVVWSVHEERAIAEWSAHDDLVSDVCLLSNERVLTCGQDGRIRIWALPDGSLESELDGRTTWIDTVRLSPDGSVAYSIGAESAILVWDLTAGRLRERWHSPNRPIAITIQPDGSRLVTAHRASGLQVWDTTSGRVVARIGRGESSYEATLSPDGTKVATGGGRRTMRVFSSASLQPLPDVVGRPGEPAAPPWRAYRGMHGK